MHKTLDPWQRGQTTLYNHLPNIWRRYPQRKPKAPAFLVRLERKAVTLLTGQVATDPQAQTMYTVPLFFSPLQLRAIAYCRVQKK